MRERKRRSSRVFLAFNIALVILIVILDAVTPAGVVVGILLGVPIVLTSFLDDRKDVSIVFGLAMSDSSWRLYGDGVRPFRMSSGCRTGSSSC
jgi:hypothetical protein